MSAPVPASITAPDPSQVLLALLFGGGNTKYLMWGVAPTMLFKLHTLHPLPVRAAGWQPAFMDYVVLVWIGKNVENKNKISVRFWY